MNYIEQKAAERLFLERRRRKWTQSAVARLTAISQRKISQSECKTRGISLGEFVAWAQAFGWHPAELLEELLGDRCSYGTAQPSTDEQSSRPATDGR